MLEVKEKVIKVYSLNLTEEEALDLRSIMHLNIDDWSLNSEQKSFVTRLKSALEGI